MLCCVVQTNGAGGAGSSDAKVNMDLNVKALSFFCGPV